VFEYKSTWRGRYYRDKKVRVVYVEEAGVAVTVTAISYFGAWENAL